MLYYASQYISTISELQFKSYILISVLYTADPWKIWGLGHWPLHAVKNPRFNFLLLPNLTANSPLFTESLTNNISSWLTHILNVFFLYCILYSYNKAKEKKIINEKKYIYSKKKNPCVSGPAQFKPILVKGQPYLCFRETISNLWPIPNPSPISLMCNFISLFAFYVTNPSSWPHLRCLEHL